MEYSGSISFLINFEYFPYEVSDKELFTIDVIKNICPDSLDWQAVVKYCRISLDSNKKNHYNLVKRLVKFIGEKILYGTYG